MKETCPGSGQDSLLLSPAWRSDGRLGAICPRCGRWTWIRITNQLYKHSRETSAP